MILPVFLYGQPVLRKEAEDVPKDYPDLKQLVANMFETMYNADGVGLAAPQVGLSIGMRIGRSTRKWWKVSPPVSCSMSASI